MYGEDSSGRRVSLLNDDTPPSTSNSISTTIRTTTFVRPYLPDRYRDCVSPVSSSARSSSHRRAGSQKSSRSSGSRSPRHSPPTPPLVRLDSRSSLNTPSPMTPQYNFDQMEHQGSNNINDNNKNGQNAGLPYYPDHYPLQNGATDNNPFPSMHDNFSQNYYPMSAQQALPSFYNDYDNFSQSAADLNRFQYSSFSQYSNNPVVLPSSTQSSILPSLPAPNTINFNHDSALKPRNDPLTSATSKTVSQLPTSAPTTAQIDDSTALTATVSTTAPASASASNTTSTASVTNTPGSAPPKKKYPCPHSKEYKCRDTFTTSGHAARHGKKHTGEKNVNCPTCGKAFTRKDNMKQHERTHKPGHSSRSAAATGGDSSSSSPIVGKSEHGGRKRTMSSSTLASMTSTTNDETPDADADGDADTDVDMGLDEQQQQSSGGHVKAERPPLGKSKLSEILEQVTAPGAGSGTGEADAEGDVDLDLTGDGESPGLHALATVAAGEMR